ncbi:MAG: hypothetical protein ABH846_00030 [Patescibacteria group bacterium]
MVLLIWRKLLIILNSMNKEVDFSGNKFRTERAEQSAINRILKEKTTETELGGSRVYTLQHGSKQLEVSFDFSTREVLTYVEKIDPDARRMNETRELYAPAKQLMENCAEETGLTFKYALNTPFESMRAWAETTGREIFDWEEEIQEKNTAPDKLKRPIRYIFKKSFQPAAEEQIAAK